jgi:hypothetical protein
MATQSLRTCEALLVALGTDETFDLRLGFQRSFLSVWEVDARGESSRWHSSRTRAKSRRASDVLMQSKVLRSWGLLMMQVESICAITSIIMVRRTSERLESESRAARSGLKFIRFFLIALCASTYLSSYKHLALKQLQKMIWVCERHFFEVLVCRNGHLKMLAVPQNACAVDAHGKIALFGTACAGN